MAARELASSIEDRRFQIGFDWVGDQTLSNVPLDRLLAIDLTVRLSNFIKSLKPQAEQILRSSLEFELPTLSIVSETASLPDEAKPAEIRENVAVSLQFASGGWITSYVVESLAKEDRSQRCRNELAKQLALREPSIDEWLGLLNETDSLFAFDDGNTSDIAASRLKSISSALTRAVKEGRANYQATSQFGVELQKLVRRLVPPRSNETNPKNLDQAAEAVIEFLDEVLSVDLILIVEPEIYSIVDTVRRWWAPLKYPRRVSEAFEPIKKKLVTAIQLRARMGQVSEGLSDQLRKVLNDRETFDATMHAVADHEPGLNSQVDDWLRGRRREGSRSSATIRRALSGVADADATTTFAELYLMAREAISSLGHSDEGQLRKVMNNLAAAVTQAGKRRSLEVVGSVGEVVEFTSNAHETIDDRLPAEANVIIVRPMVVRTRSDGSRDVVVKALVKDC